MIQKYFKIAASQEAIRRELFAFETWPQWWPGVQRVAVLRSDGSKSVVDLTVKTAATINMTVEFDAAAPNIVKFRQLKGWFKSYRGEYAMSPAPDNAGTTVKITIELETGAFVPKGMVYSKLSANLAELGDVLARRVLQQPAAVNRPAAAAAPAAARIMAAPVVPEARTITRTVAHLFSTAKGLEAWIDGRPYRLSAVR